jgi:hypothetical protein
MRINSWEQIMNGINFCNYVEKYCLSGRFGLLSANHRLQPVVMKISPFRTSCRNDLKSQIFITAWSSTCGKNLKKNNCL